VVSRDFGQGYKIMTDWNKFFARVNVFIYQITKGRLGNRMGRQSVLLLHTNGRKSGKSYVTSLSFYRYGNTYLVVASNWGKEYHPDWFHNLMKHPYTTIQVGPTTLQVEARQAEEEEYQRLWEMIVRKNDQYIHYQKGLKRRIPIVILTPTTLL
jgi:deazaflavin-dependent oxidoreductase (nitroreductase family)